MRIQQIITISGVIITVILIAGCSKRSDQQSQVVAPPNTTDYSLETRKEFAPYVNCTNLDVLQQKYQEDMEQIRGVQARLDLLRRQYKITDTSSTQLDETDQSGNKVITAQQPYWDEKRKLSRMIDFNMLLAAKIEAVKLDQQIKPQNSPH